MTVMRARNWPFPKNTKKVSMFKMCWIFNNKGMASVFTWPTTKTRGNIWHRWQIKITRWFGIQFIFLYNFAERIFKATYKSSWRKLPALPHLMTVAESGWYVYKVVFAVLLKYCCIAVCVYVIKIENDTIYGEHLKVSHQEL